MNILLWIVFLGGIFNITISFATNTKNFKSALLFKVIPFSFGICQLICSLEVLEIIDIIK